MKICIKYGTKFNTSNDVELIITPQNYLSALYNYPDKTFFMEFSGNAETFVKNADLLPKDKVTIYTNSYRKNQVAKNLGFKTCAGPVYNYEILQEVLKNGYDSVILQSGNILFDLNNLKNILQNYPSVTIRVFPLNNGLNKFWISPQAVTYYEEFFDYLMFPFEMSQEKEAIYLNAYSSGKIWKSNLNNFMLEGFPDLDDSLLKEDFFKKRQNCKQICQEGKCHFCNIYAELNLLIREELKK